MVSSFRSSIAPTILLLIEDHTSIKGKACALLAVIYFYVLVSYFLVSFLFKVFFILDMLRFSNRSVEDNTSGYVNTGFIEETESTGGSVATKYITREVTLDQTSGSLRILASVNRRNSCDIDFYYRLKTTNDDIFSELPWTLLDRPIEYSPASATYGDFKEYDFDERGLPEFSSVAVKIVLKTTNSAVVPRVRDLRIIALAS